VLVSVLIQLTLTPLRFTSFSLALLRALKQQPYRIKGALQRAHVRVLRQVKKQRLRA
jgi:hypothetical protein